jgi:hypothetical protein
MIFESVAFGLLAAASGTVFRYLSGVVAERSGHTKREGEAAAASAGISLIAKTRHEPPPAANH